MNFLSFAESIYALGFVMKPIATLSTILLAGYCSATELNPSLLRLIPVDARMVSGVDIDREANSALNRFFLSDFNPDAGARVGDNVVWIGYRRADATKGSSTLTAIIGATPSHEPESQDIGDRLVSRARNSLHKSRFGPILGYAHWPSQETARNHR